MDQLELVVVLDGGLIEVPTNENVLFALLPRVVMAAMQSGLASRRIPLRPGRPPASETGRPRCLVQIERYAV
jgi:hypothetical protein